MCTLLRNCSFTKSNYILVGYEKTEFYVEVREENLERKNKCFSYRQLNVYSWAQMNWTGSMQPATGTWLRMQRLHYYPCSKMYYFHLKIQQLLDLIKHFHLLINCISKNNHFQIKELHITIVWFHYQWNNINFYIVNLYGFLPSKVKI